MALREILINGQPILIEVSDLTVENETAATRGVSRLEYIDSGIHAVRLTSN